MIHFLVPTEKAWHRTELAIFFSLFFKLMSLNWSFILTNLLQEKLIDLFQTFVTKSLVFRRKKSQLNLNLTFVPKKN